MLRWYARVVGLGIVVVSAACGGRAADTVEAGGVTPTTLAETRVATADGDLEQDATTTSSSPEPVSTATTGPSPTGPATTGEDHPTDSVPPTPTTSTGSLDDRALAESVRLRAADLPGWSIDPARHVADPSASNALPPGCRYLAAVSKIAVTGKAQSPAFASTDGLSELFNDVSMYATENEAQSVLSTLDRDTTAACFEKILIGSDDMISIDDASVGATRVTQADGGIAYTAKLSVVVGGRPYTFVSRFSYARSGRAVTFQMAFGYKTLPNETEPAFTAVLRRLSRAHSRDATNSQ
jgi:hypothetical protein